MSRTHTKINRTQFIETLSLRLSITKKHAEEIYHTVFGLIEENLLKDIDVNLTGFGLFKISERRERIGVDPQKGVKMKIPRSKSVSFKVGKTLREKVRAH